MFTAGVFETVVSDERETVTDEIKMPIPLESADRFKDIPSFLDKIVQAESGRTNFFFQVGRVAQIFYDWNGT
ncbi:MAG TPA: hypothetical protein VJW55_03045 [Candidatus Angelobacter sp.]|nr:hypothetical protein [Candidatus Angelobacter sp.]